MKRNDAASHGNFVWCDLSSYEPDRAKAFYRKLFGWRYRRTQQPDGAPYFIAYAGKKEVAGIFEMPAKFRDMGLPSFWMPYISVDNLERACETAARHHAKVEIGPVAISETDRVALIRDPLGAGFTVHEGAGLRPPDTAIRKGHAAWRGLYVSDADAVRSFYSDMFGWRIARDGAGDQKFRIQNKEGDEIAELVELGEEIRGQYEFWALYFVADNLRKAKRRIVKLGGEIVYEDQSRQPAILAKDMSGAAFFVV